MIIRLYPENNALPIGPAVNRVGSALPLRIVGAPSGVTAVAVSVFNADGAACNLAATLRGGEWVATVPASHFASWGKVARGLQVSVSYKDETDTTQTVVFVGDVRIERTAAGDPEGTGKRSVPVTEVDEVADGSSMKDIRDKVNELARIVSGTATALVLMALPLSAATPLEDIPGTNEVYTAAETDAAIQTAIGSIPPPASMTTNAVCDIVTNEVAVDYSPWTILRDGAGVSVAQPQYTNNVWRVESSTIPGEFPDPVGIDGTKNDVSLTWLGVNDDDWEETHTYVATRNPTTTRNALGLARLVDLPPLTNGIPALIDSAIADADTTYTRFAISAPTNVNQSVQYVNIADENPSVLSVVIPEGTGTKDWIIYVQSVTNVSINLPAATWWMADAASTNDIAPATPTALYFSEIGSGKYLFSRQELTEVITP